jgi:hypothetical protein
MRYSKALKTLVILLYVAALLYVGVFHVPVYEVWGSTSDKRVNRYVHQSIFKLEKGHAINYIR